MQHAACQAGWSASSASSLSCTICVCSELAGCLIWWWHAWCCMHHAAVQPLCIPVHGRCHQQALMKVQERTLRAIAADTTEWEGCVCMAGVPRQVMQVLGKLGVLTGGHGPHAGMRLMGPYAARMHPPGSQPTWHLRSTLKMAAHQFAVGGVLVRASYISMTCSQHAWQLSCTASALQREWHQPAGGADGSCRCLTTGLRLTKAYDRAV
jgi:hypothetical protein